MLINMAEEKIEKGIISEEALEELAGGIGISKERLTQLALGTGLTICAVGGCYASYKQGQKNGIQQGYALGNKEGYDLGRNEGYASGSIEGVKEGIKFAFSKNANDTYKYGTISDALDDFENKNQN